MAIIVFVSLISNLPPSNSHQIAMTNWRSPTLNSLYSVCMVNSTYGWAVGAGGTIICWNGIQWSNVTSPTVADLDSVFFTNAHDGWAVGAYGMIIQWNGTCWNRVPGPTYANLASVCIVNADDGWAVGQTVQNIVSGYKTWVWTIIHWNGSSWTNSTSPPEIGNNLFSVAMANSVDGWAVGPFGTILHWNGTQWSLWAEYPSSTLAAFNSIYLINADDGWAVGDMGTIFHWDGTQWTSARQESTEDYLSVFFVDAYDGWIAGGAGMFYEIGSSSPVYHWNDSMWTSVDNPSTNPIALRSVFMVDANDGWIVGDGGIIMRWTGVEWTIPEYPRTLYFVLVPGVVLATIVLSMKLLKEKRQSHYPKT